MEEGQTPCHRATANIGAAFSAICTLAVSLSLLLRVILKESTISNRSVDRSKLGSNETLGMRGNGFHHVVEDIALEQTQRLR